MTDIDARDHRDDEGNRSRTPASIAENDSLAPGSTRRDFVLGVALVAAGLGCRSHPAKTAVPAVPGPVEPAPEAVDPDVQAVRDHVLRLEAPPSFVFTTSFRDVP